MLCVVQQGIASEVWVALGTVNTDRYAFDGTYLGQYKREVAGVADMEVVYDEVWVALGTVNTDRYAFDGTYLGQYKREVAGVADTEVMPQGIPESAAVCLLAHGAVLLSIMFLFRRRHRSISLLR